MGTERRPSPEETDGAALCGACDPKAGLGTEDHIQCWDNYRLFGQERACTCPCRKETPDPPAGSDR